MRGHGSLQQLLGRGPYRTTRKAGGSSDSGGEPQPANDAQGSSRQQQQQQQLLAFPTRNQQQQPAAQRSKRQQPRGADPLPPAAKAKRQTVLSFAPRPSGGNYNSSANGSWDNSRPRDGATASSSLPGSTSGGGAAAASSGGRGAAGRPPGPPAVVFPSRLVGRGLLKPRAALEAGCSCGVQRRPGNPRDPNALLVLGADGRLPAG